MDNILKKILTITLSSYLSIFFINFAWERLETKKIKH